MDGGDLIDRILERAHYSEGDAREVCRQLLFGVEFCHSRKIANRNLKPENLLLVSKTSDTDVKISDFGYAKKVLFPNSLRTQCGTEGYVAPEILEHRPAYDVKCDMWSLGVIIYIVLGGYRPFQGESDEVMKNTRYGNYKFHSKYWSHVSNDAKDLVRGLLTVDPDTRLSAAEALKSAWINADVDTLGKNNLASNKEQLKDFHPKAKFRQVVHLVSIYMLPIWVSSLSL
jgi:serine/threonine protein kinase